MLICPDCRAEYVTGYTHCAPCDAALVAPESLTVGGALSPRAALAGVERVQIAASSLSACRELEQTLVRAGIPAYIDTADGCAPKGGCACSYVVVLGRADVEQAGAVLDGKFREMLAREGVGMAVDAAVDLGAAEVACPACGHQGALADDGTCADCGLMLGVPGA